MKKKKLILLLSAFLSISLVFLVIVGGSTKNYLFPGIAENISYGITFNSNKNKFHSYTGTIGYDGEATIQTNLGNNINFSYYQIKGVNSTWHVLGNGGYFYNINPIHGIESISLSFKTNSANYSIYYSGDDAFDQHQSFVSSTSEITTFDFNEYKPNYFKIVNESGANFNIASINILLSCDNIHPIVSVSSENEKMGTVTGGGVKAIGEAVTITATPNTGYQFIGWFKDDELVSSNSAYTFTMSNADLSYVARFTYKTYSLIVQSESEIKGMVSNSTGNYDYLSSITINATPNSGYSFLGWYKGSSLVSSDNPYTFNMPSSNTTYTAKFSTNSYNLVLNNNNEDLGSISGSGTFLYGSSVTIIATPNIGVSFLGWYDSNDNLVSNQSTYTFNMPYEDLSYTAKFEWTPYSIELTVNNTDMGSVTGSGSYIYQQEVILVATPNEHYSFFGWYDGDELISQESTYTFNMPNNLLNYEARFVKNHNLYVYSDDESKGTVSAPNECGEGFEVTVTANANIGYALDYWYDDDLNELSYDFSYTFVMPNHDVTLYAAFDVGYTLTVMSDDESKGTVTGSGQYKAGREVTVTLNYISGTFKGWFDGDNQIVSMENNVTFAMPSYNYFLEARFVTQEEVWNNNHGVIPQISSSYIKYGLYPQKNINDSSLISELNKLTTIESNGWYLYENEYYAKVDATPYRSNYEFDNGTTIVSGTTYWFKCEPIRWRILCNNNDECYLLSSVSLDVYCYYNSTSSRTIDGQTVYPSNYEYSDIRAWLNNDFYNSAFALNNEYIQTTAVNNSASTTDSSYNSYTCDNTKDKVFLPSYRDYLNKSYGFSSSPDASAYSNNTGRLFKLTDWARARGGWYSTDSRYFTGSHWARSPHSRYSDRAWAVDSSGCLSGSYCVYRTYVSVCPAITLKIA